MAKIALGVTIALLLVTCFFGFETKSNIQGLEANLARTNDQLATSEQNLTKTKADLKTAQDNEAKAEADLASAKAQLATVQSNLDAATAQAKDLTAKLADAQTQIDTLKKAGPPVATPNGPTLADMDKLNTQLKDAQAQIAELNQVKETLANKEQDAEKRSDDLEKQVERYQSHIVKNGLEGEVLAVNHDWNFVVLSIGDRQGAVSNAEMVLTRGASQIGKVRITEVEPSTSVADIIPGTLARGVSVQPGDHVIFPGG